MTIYELEMEIAAVKKKIALWEDGSMELVFFENKLMGLYEIYISTLKGMLLSESEAKNRKAA